MNKDHLFLIFGATGDLVSHKVLPALNIWMTDLEQKGLFPYHHIVCIGRRPFNTEQYLQYLNQKTGLTLSPELTARIQYFSMDFTDLSQYRLFADYLIHCFGSPGRLTCYLAVKPLLFPLIPHGLSKAGLHEKNNPLHQLIFEKPFGDSFENAHLIQEQLLEVADESQIYRIDHYLGKEMIRNILALRFTNRIFEESWCGSAIETVEIISRETEGVEERLDYYDSIGAISDMVQSHLLQLLALVTMDCPGDLGAEAVHLAKTNLLKHVSSLTPTRVITGQYKGYANSTDPTQPSKTETFVKAEWLLNLPRWQGTRFILETGKCLSEKLTEIKLTFRAHSYCANRQDFGVVPPNEVIIQIHPKDGVHLRFNSKAPGYDYKVEPVQVDYCHSCRFVFNKPEAYVKLLKDAAEFDTTLFTNFEELELQWQITDQLKKIAAKIDPTPYPIGITTLQFTEET